MRHKIVSALKTSLRALAKQSIFADMKQPAVYILANKPNGTLYVGVTSKLAQRMYQHRHGIASGFAGRFGCRTLVWFEVLETMESAIAREKQIKAGSRTAKVQLIMAANPEWADLYDRIV